MGPVRRNHCQIGRAKAVSWWIQHSDGPAWNRIYALRARTGETTTKCWLNRRNNAQHNQNRIRRHVTCNDRMWTVLITTWAQTAFKIQRLRHVKQLLSWNSFQRLRQDETVLIELVFFAFFLLVFCLRFFFHRGRLLHNYVSHALLHQHVITILPHGPLYTLHLCTSCNI